jgi:pimeloyl-ACP methyl ester carboxylesterase
VLAHGFTGVRAARLDAYASRFASAGYAALVFDYRGFGESGGEPRQVIDVRMQLDDWRSAIAFARTLDGVDPDRIVLWGTSFSGGHVMELAADDSRVAAAISQNPFVDGIAALAAAGPINLIRLTVAGLRDESRRLRGLSPYLAPAVGPPGTLAAMNQPGSDEGFKALIPAGYDGWPNAVAGRIFLRIGLYRPIRRAREIHCPWLVMAAVDDLVTPPEPAVRAGLTAPRGEVARQPGGHWDIYVSSGFERAVEAQVAFLERNVPVRASTEREPARAEVRAQP